MKNALIYIYIYVYKHILPLNFETKIFISKYFPKIPSEMNSTHPFYHILIPTPHM